MSGLLDGRLALVTGAGRGIGYACAAALAEAGASVVAIARSADDLDVLAEAGGGRIETWIGDVTDDDLLARIGSLSALDILINNAGANRPQPFVDVDIDSLDAILDLNVRAA
ncbi:MAG: SDR family oxidoreductase, partial [Gammaproteobacteria bacterium]|nr:SDR family oxidoreductase [Gammaproteobacteria bacterium]